ncbi:hypothetical protein AB0D08_22660 [Kitasatospora sp. NPDC048540]|uniref:hypothetical protein n=1 Tax=Kitasatospora sp. NPDC048540 TaxID=3155634 RepID=UPI0033F1A027
MRRLRRLAFDGHEFHWTGRIGHLRDAAGVRRCVHLRVRSGRQGSLLAVALVSVPSPPLPWGAATDGSYPTPREVRTVVELALAEGWQPLARGGPFELRTLRLPGWELPALSGRSSAPPGRG